MKIAILSDSPMLPTGYSNQAKQLTKYLADKGHEIHWFANGYSGATLDHVKFDDGTEFNFKIYGAGAGDAYFNKTLTTLLRQIKPDRFIVLLDTFMLFPWFLNLDTAPAKTFFWFPSDGGGGLPAGCESILRKVNCPVAMARYGQKQVKDYYGLDVAHIPHGLDKNRFYQLPEADRLELKKKWGFQDKFVIGVVARNQPRKALDRTIKGMKLIAEKIPNAVLFLHLDPKDVAQQAFQIPNLVKKYGLENRVIYSGMEWHKGFGWDKMNEVYNVMDMFLLTTTGEGFGIPIIEAMACGVPVLATDYTTTPELVLEHNAGLGINLAGVEPVEMFNFNSKDYDTRMFDGTMTGSWEVERGLCSVADIATKTEILYKDPELRKKMGVNGRKAVLAKYSFDVVGQQWEDLLCQE